MVFKAPPSRSRVQPRARAQGGLSGEALLRSGVLQKSLMEVRGSPGPATESGGCRDLWNLGGECDESAQTRGLRVGNRVK